MRICNTSSGSVPWPRHAQRLAKIWRSVPHGTFLQVFTRLRAGPGQGPLPLLMLQILIERMPGQQLGKQHLNGLGPVEHTPNLLRQGLQSSIHHSHGLWTELYAQLRMNRPGQTTLGQGRQLTWRCQGDQSLDMFVGFVVTQVDPEFLGFGAGYPDDLAQLAPSNQAVGGLVGESWKFLQSSGHVAKLTGLLGLQAENQGGIMNGSAAAVVKVVAMAVHRQKTAPQ